MADKNSTFRFADIEKETPDAADKIQASAWNDIVQHMKDSKERIFGEKFPYLAARICQWKTQAIQT